MAVRVVVFDVGGVLCNTPRTHWEADWARKLGMGEAQLIEALRSVGDAGSLGTIAADEVEIEVGHTLTIDVNSAAALMKDVWNEYVGSPNAAMIKFLRALRPTYRTALLSNSFTGARERERAAYDFESMCDRIFYSHEVGFSKPDPEIYRLVNRVLGVRPTEVLFIDDIQENIDAARLEGWSAIRFTTEQETVRELTKVLTRAQ